MPAMNAMRAEVARMCERFGLDPARVIWIDTVRMEAEVFDGPMPWDRHIELLGAPADSA